MARKTKTLWFRTIEELHVIPKDKLQAFTVDLALWLHEHRLSAEHGFKITTARDAFGWLDDGKHVVRLEKVVYPRCDTCVQIRQLGDGEAWVCPVVNIRIHRDSVKNFGCMYHSTVESDKWPDDDPLEAKATSDTEAGSG